MTEQLLVEIEILKKKLAEWEKKKEDGLIIELPVPIGTLVWGINEDNETACTFLVYENMQPVIKWWGKTIFATREEAETRLGELRNDSK